MSDDDFDFDLDFNEDDDFIPMDEPKTSDKSFDRNDDKYYYDDDEDDEFERRPERDAFERVGMYGIEPTERFYRIAEAIVLDLNENVIPSPFSAKDIEKIKVTIIPKYEYKNPTAYVLGYLGSSKKLGIKKSSIENVFKNILPYVEDKSVTKPDVVRYSILWDNL